MVCNNIICTQLDDYNYILMSWRCLSSKNLIYETIGRPFLMDNDLLASIIFTRAWARKIKVYCFVVVVVIESLSSKVVNFT